MDMNQILITDENYQDFASVLPAQLSGRNRTFLSDAMQEQLFEVSYLYERFYVLPENLEYLAGLKVKVKAISEQFFQQPGYRQHQMLELISGQYEVNNFELWEKSCAKELCRVVYRGNQVDALILFSHRTDGDLDLTFLYGKSPKSLIKLLLDTVAEKNLRYPGAKIIFDATTLSAERLARKLFPEAKTVPLYEAER